MVFHISGKKRSDIARKVVLVDGRDRKNTVWSHLVAEKLSVTSYFCPRTWSEPDWSHIFPRWDSGRGTTFDSNTRNPGNPGFLSIIVVSWNLCLSMCDVDVKISRYLALCRCARGFHVITGPRGAEMRWLKLAVLWPKLAVAWISLLRLGSQDPPPPHTCKNEDFRRYVDLAISEVVYK